MWAIAELEKKFTVTQKQEKVSNEAENKGENM
jgi:hypothetical protein